MSRINTNVQSMIAQRVLGQQNLGLGQALERLSTGLAVNRGADDPAGLIASENLRSEEASIAQAIRNAERANQVVNIAEGGLQEVSGLLIEIQGLINQSANSAGLSLPEKEANQLQIDSILQTIDRISSSTSFQGTKLINGTFDFTISAQASTVSGLTVNAAKLEHGDSRDVEILVTASAQHGAIFLSAGNAANVLDFGGNATESFIFEVAGADGSREFTFASGTSLTQVAEMINTFKAVTGVSAVASGVYLELKSDQFGSNEFVRVRIVDDASGNQTGAIKNADSGDENTLDAGAGTTFANATNAIRDDGQDVSTIINGMAATAKGRVASINTDFLDLSVELSDTGAQTLASISAFTITGGGARFHLGPKVDITNQARLGIGDVAVRNLGNVADGYLDELIAGGAKNVVDGDLEGAQKVVDASIGQVASLRGRLGAFQKNVVGASIRSLGVALENTSAAESSIRDTDFAGETARLTRSQILVNAATNVLAIANAQPQAVLALLG